jgi:hypothetical protein
LAHLSCNYTIYSQVESAAQFNSKNGIMTLTESDVRIECVKKSRLILWRDITFSVEICRERHSNGEEGFQITCKRTKGDKWIFKRVYEAFYALLKTE